MILFLTIQSYPLLPSITYSIDTKSIDTKSREHSIDTWNLQLCFLFKIWHLEALNETFSSTLIQFIDPRLGIIMNPHQMDDDCEMH